MQNRYYSVRKGSNRRIKLYFGNTVAAITTFMIVALLGFIGYSVYNRTNIQYWGRRTVILLFFGLVICCFAAARDNLDKTIQHAIDGSCAPVLLSFITSLFIGSEYSDGTMRNKLVVGHKRYAIYLSNLIVCTAAGLALCFAYLIPHTCLFVALLGKFETALKTLILYTGMNLFLTVVFASLFIMIAMLCQNKAYSTAGCILLVFALLFAGIRIVSALNEPEYHAGYSYTENGGTTTEDAEQNPNYLNGTKRQIYEFLNDFTPGGQVLKLANMNAEKPAMLVLYDGIILIFAASCGIVFFRYKDLK